MAFVPVTDVAKTEVIYTLAGVEVVNIFHSKQSGGWNATSLGLLNGYYSSWLTTQLMPNLSAQIEVVNIISTDIAVAAGAQVNLPSAIIGGDAGDALPANAALVMSWRTGFSGRSFRGRSYIAGVPAHNQTSPQTIDPTEAAAIQTAGTQLISQLASVAVSLVVVSYFSGLAPRVTPVATPITVCIVNSQIDTQRKRLKQ